MLKLILGDAGSGKTARILSEITENARRGVGGQYLIVPEQYSHEAERELVLAGGDGICLHAEVLSFSRLALRVAQQAGNGGRTQLDKAGRLLCLSLALDKVAPALQLYSAAGRKSELQAGLFAAVEELKAAQISADALQKAAQGASGILQKKLFDLALCLEGYNAVLAQGHADPTDALVRLAETLSNSTVGSSPIFLDGFTDFTGAEMRVIDALLKKGADLTVCLTCDSLSADTEHFDPSRRAALALLRMAKDAGCEASTELLSSDSEKLPPLRFFDTHLFAYSSETAEANGAVELLSCTDLREECELAAAKCLCLVRETGCRWRDIAVAARGFDSFSAPLEDAFVLYGVPLITASRDSILQKSAPAAIAAAFEVIGGSWALADVLSYIKTGLTGLSPEEADALSAYGSLWNLRGSYWYRERGFTSNPEGFAAEWTDEARQRLKEINAARERLCAPLRRLSQAGKSAKTALGQAQALADYLEEINLAQTLAAHADELEKAGLNQLAAETSQLWEIIVRALEQLSGILGDTPMTQEEFSRLYSRTLAQYDVSAIPASPDSVSAGEIDRMRRRHIKHLILLGASDDRIPCVSAPGGVLSEDERDELRELGLELGGGGDDRLKREFSLIYNCITLPGESLTISYTLSDNNGAVTRPSFVAKRAGMLFGIEAQRFDLDAARATAPGPAFLLAAGGSAAAREYFRESEEGALRLQSLEARRACTTGGLSPVGAEALYGQTKSLSPSQAESFASCRFGYFLRYGLRLDEREKAGFTPPELGTFMHYVLENTLREIASKNAFSSITDEEAGALSEKYTGIYVAERLGGFEDKSARFVYLFDRLRPSVRRITLDAVRELSHSDFRPLDFELKFMRDGDLPPIEIAGAAARIVGIADRVDGFEKDGKLYLRVIDYKTGKKTFSLSEVWNGMGMQMLIYLFALENEGTLRYGKPIVPAGVLYVPAKDVTVSAPADMTDEALAAQRAKNLKRSGLLLRDEDLLSSMEHGIAGSYLPVSRKKDGSLTSDSLADAEQFQRLGSFISEKLSDAASQLASGSIDIEPCYRSQSDNACTYCPYGSVCRFDDATGKRRYLEKLKPEEFWARLGGGNNG